MKIKQLSPHIYKLEKWVGIKISMWIVLDNEGITLIDTGLKFMGNKLQKMLEKQGNLVRILLTHGHPDHVGSLNCILQHYEVPVYAHRDEEPYLQGEIPYPGKKKSTRVVEHGIIRAFSETGGKYDMIGGLRPYHTPGHSPGHIVFHHEEEDVLIAGDLFTSKNGQLRRPIPMFTADMAKALDSGKEILEYLNPGMISLCHGEDNENPVYQI